MLLKKIFRFWWGKKYDSEFLSCKLMLNSGKKNILTLVLSEKQILNEKKNHTPPFLVKWSVPYSIWVISSPAALPCYTVDLVPLTF